MSESKRINPYTRGKIYRITVNDLTYYGSTIQSLSKRIWQHKDFYLRHQQGQYYHCSSFKLFENEMKPIITLVEDFPCERKEQLLARERFYIENNECVNKIIPGRTNYEYRQDNAEQIREYFKINAKRISEYKRDYAKQNATAICEYKKKYYQMKKNNNVITPTYLLSQPSP